MKHCIPLLFILGAAAGGTCWAAPVRAQINVPAERAAVLKRAELLVSRGSGIHDTVPADVKNPFVLQQDAEAAPVSAHTLLPSSARERVAFLGGLLSPTGSAERDGEQFLLFGQRKVKVGEVLPVVFENAQFELEVVAIERGTFTVRLNNEEFTRPIKPGKTP